MQVKKDVFASSPVASRVYDLLIRLAAKQLAEQHLLTVRLAVQGTNRTHNRGE